MKMEELSAGRLRELIEANDPYVLSGYLIFHSVAIAQALEDAKRLQWQYAKYAKECISTGTIPVSVESWKGAIDAAREGA